MKKVFILTCVLIMTFSITNTQDVDAASTSTSINTEPITEVFKKTIPEKELDSFLLDKGVEYDIVSNMSYFNKYDLYTDLLPKNAEYAGTKTIGYNEETGNSYIVDTNSKGQIGDSYLLLRISSVNYYTDAYYLDKVMLKVSYDWKITPFWKKTDSIGMSWNSEDFFYSSHTFVAKNCAHDSVISHETFCQTINNVASITDSGLFWYADLFGSAKNHYGYGKIYLKPETGVDLIEGSTTFTTLYVHKKISGSVGISIVGLNLSVNYGSNYDSMGDSDRHSWNISHMH